MEGRNWRGAFPPLAPGPPPFVGLAPHPPVGGPPTGGNYPLSSLFAAVASADPHAHFHSTIASDQLAKAAAAAKVKQACLPCKKAHTACDEGRPCKKCVEMGKADQCVDVERKKAGRPKKNPAAAVAAAAAPAAAAATATSTTTTTTAATAAPPAKPQNEPSRKRARIDGPVDQKFVAPSASPSPSASSSSSSSSSSSPSPSQPPQPHPHQPPPHSHSQPPQPPPPSSAHEPQPQPQPQPPQFGSVPAGQGQPQAGPPPAQQQQQQERQNEKELLSSAVSFLLDQVRLLSNTVESLRQEVNQLKSNQHNNINTAAADSPLSPSTTTTTTTAASVPFSCPSPMGNVPRSPSPLPSPSFASHPTPSGSTAYFYSYPPPLSSSPSPPSYSSPSPFSPPPPPPPTTTTTGVSTSSSSSSTTLSTPPPPGHVVTTSTYTTQPGPLGGGGGGGQAQHQYIPIAALPHCREMMDHFSFLLAFDLKSSYLPFVVDDLTKPVCVVRSPPAGDDSVPPVFYFVNRSMAELLLYRVDELVGHSVLGIYAPDDKTKIQLMPHVADLPFSPIILFSPLVIRKDGTIVRMSTRLQTFSTRRLTPDWTIIVVDGIEEVGATLGSSSMHVPQLPKWLGQNTTAFLKSVLSMTGLPRNPGGGASLHQFPGSSPGSATASAPSPTSGGMSPMGHGHIGRFHPSLRMLGDAGTPPHQHHQHHTSTTANQHHPPLPQVSLEEVEEDVAGKPNPSGDADLNELLTQLMPASAYTPDYASWIGEGTGGGGGGDYASPLGDSAAPDSHHQPHHQS